ncbi:MAG: hypothetical protein LBQ50_07110 [Planctomycetaceae bacterium]|jgi:uncharacterized repeat protein (TIGR04138 family)|nr:hypothetical protein [Planctomycetaceae bacterium]
MPFLTTPFIELLKRDRRYKAEAYAFIYEALGYAQNVLGLGKKEMSEPFSEDVVVKIKVKVKVLEQEKTFGLGDHITGQELCFAARDYAIAQYGFLAKMVLDSIGIRKTDDIGEIVYNLISIGQMRKTPQDRREDFNNVFDFETAFEETYQIHSNNV